MLRNNTTTIFSSSSSSNKQQQPPPPPKKQQKRRVQFNEHVDVVRLPSHLSFLDDDQRLSMWFQQSELDQIALAARDLGQSVRNQFGDIQLSNPIAYINVLKRTYVSCMTGKTPTKQDVHDLAYWYRVCSGRRGLEKHFCPSVLQDRLKRIEYCLDSVFCLQEQLRGNPMAYAQRAEMIRESSQLVSATAATYARVQGMADAMACMQEERDEALARKVLENKKRKLSAATPPPPTTPTKMTAKQLEMQRFMQQPLKAGKKRAAPTSTTTCGMGSPVKFSLQSPGMFVSKPSMQQQLPMRYPLLHLPLKSQPYGIPAKRMMTMTSQSSMPPVKPQPPVAAILEQLHNLPQHNSVPTMAPQWQPVTKPHQQSPMAKRRRTVCGNLYVPS